ncbi:hypothetical protein Tco_0701079, partial [Tanacetum coccineum]
MKEVRGSVITGGDKVVTWYASWLGGDKEVMEVLSKVVRKVVHYGEGIRGVRLVGVVGGRERCSNVVLRGLVSCARKV